MSFYSAEFLADDEETPDSIAEATNMYKLLLSKPRAIGVDIFHQKINSSVGVYEVIYPYIYNNYKTLPLMRNFVFDGFDVIGFLNALPEFEVLELCLSETDGTNTIIRLRDCGSLIYIHRAVIIASPDYDGFVKLAEIAEKYVAVNCKDEIDIHIVHQSNGGLYLRKTKIKIPEIDVEYNYGQSFYTDHHPKIINALKTKHTGCYIFSGPPGTGKTFYIQHLASISDKKFIYLPESLISSGLDSPAVIALLIENQNSVLIIEDGEKFIMSRKDEPNSLVSTILNISEGMLSAIAKCSVIITHNQFLDANNIDPALMRKGRLNYTYTFGKLNTEDANRKLKQLGLDYQTKEPMSLGDIFNLQGETNFAKTEKRIGF